VLKELVTYDNEEVLNRNLYNYFNSLFRGKLIKKISKKDKEEFEGETYTHKTYVIRGYVWLNDFNLGLHLFSQMLFLTFHVPHKMLLIREYPTIILTKDHSNRTCYSIRFRGCLVPMEYQGN
jgi:hypothetical protein